MFRKQSDASDQTTAMYQGEADAAMQHLKDLLLAQSAEMGELRDELNFDGFRAASTADEQIGALLDLVSTLAAQNVRLLSAVEGILRREANGL